MSYQNVLEDMNRQVAESELARQRIVETILEIERVQSEHQQIVELMEYDHESARQAMLDAERTLSASIQSSQELQPSRLAEMFAFDEERNRQAMLDAERTLSEHSRLAEMFAFDEERDRQVMLDVERTLSASIQSSQELQPMMHERMASLIEGTEIAQERKQRMLFEREEDSDEDLTGLLSLNEFQWIEVMKFAQQKNRYSKIEIVKGRVVNAAWTLTPSVFFELIKFLLSDGDQQLIYLMEKIKDLPVEEISKVLEEIIKNVDGFLL